MGECTTMVNEKKLRVHGGRVPTRRTGVTPAEQAEIWRRHLTGELLLSISRTLVPSLGFSLIAVGSRGVPAAELALLLLLEAILSPLWVWAGADEIPRDPTLIGGAFVLAAVGVQAAHGIRCERMRARCDEQVVESP
jgi:hypothetical protein